MEQAVATQPELFMAMAPVNSNKKVRPSQTPKRPSSSSKADRSVGVDVRPRIKSACGPTTRITEDLLSKEEEYKLMNAELEAKTAAIVKEADQLMREHDELTDTSHDEGSRIKHHQSTEKDPSVKAVTKKEGTPALPNMHSGKGQEHTDDLSAVAGSPEVLLANVVRGIEARVEDRGADDERGTGESTGPGRGIADARVHILGAKVRIMQEELDQLSREFYKKDDLNDKLSARIKELEDDGAKLQKTVTIQRAQIEKHKASLDESSRNRDGLQLEVSALKKEVEDLNKSHKQATASHNSTEVRLNRALQEVDRLKTQMNKMKQVNEDKISEEHQSKENLLAENKLLRKQKEELILAFKKQLKLIDVLNRQKMHFEAAKLLSFQEDEFMKALDWGTS